MDLISLATGIVPDTSFEFTSTVVIAGIVIVVAMLILLIIIFNVFGLIVGSAASKSTKKSSKKQSDSQEMAVATAPVAKAEAVAQNGISGEIVAAISAAIYALEGESAQICSITPAVATAGAPVPATKTSPITSRNPWAQAAVVENTRAF